MSEHPDDRSGETAQDDVDAGAKAADAGTLNGYGPPEDHGKPSDDIVSTGPILPGIGDNIMSGWALVRIIAIMCFLASLALGAMLAVNDAANKWSNNLTGAMTIQLKPTKAMSEEKQIAETRALLAETAGIAGVSVLSKSASADLLEPWLGNGDILTELPLPVLVEVALKPGDDGLKDFSALRSALEARVPGAVLDDHRRWNSQLDRVSNALKLLSLGILVLIVAATVMIIIFATRSGLAANEQIVEVLHLIGAHDALIAREFQTHFFWIALWAGLMGIGAAGLTFLALGYASQIGWASETIAFLPTLAFSPAFYVFLVFVPLGAIAVTVLTARITVIRTLSQVV